MAVSFKVIRFQKNSSGTDGVTQDIDATFPPKACIVITTSTATSASSVAHFAMSIGYSDGTNNVCVSGLSRDALNTVLNSNYYREDACLLRMDESSALTTLDRASISFPSGNTVRFTWTENGTVASWVTLIVIGGSDILNVKVGSATLTSTTQDATQDITGLGFTPVTGNAILFQLNGNRGSSDTAASGGMKPSMGVAVSTTKRWAKAVASADNVGTTTCWAYSTNARFMPMMLSASGAVQTDIDFNGWITDGFQLAYDDPPASADRRFGYMVINGGNWDCGTDTTQTSNTAKNHTVSVGGNTLRGLFTMTPNKALGWQAASTTGVDDATLSFGCSDGTTHSYDSALDENAAGTSDSYRQNGSNRALFHLADNGATLFAASFTSFGTDQFTLTYTTTTGAADPFGWVVVADAPTSQNFNGNITETSLSVSETLARILGATRPITETSISVNQTLARILGALRPISEPSISTSDSVTRVWGVLRSISEPSISSGETLARILGALRPISEPSISSGETLARILGALRPISETSITVNQTLTGLRSVPRTISEPAITSDETLTRLLAALRPISEPSNSSGETLARILGALRSISEPSISSGETLVRILGALRSISEPSISIDDTLTRILGATRSITESSITVNQTLTRILGALRSISEPSISSGETLTRILGALRSITESSISVGETLTRILGALRSIAETAITTDDSVSGIKEIGGVSITEDAITIDDSVTRIQGLIKTITEDTITIDDAIVRILGALRTVSEPSISINDSVTGLREVLRTISEDAITIDATVTRIQNIIKTITEDTDIDETLQVLRASYVTIVEAYVKWYYSLLTYKGGS
jgi:hypothetical protein